MLTTLPFYGFYYSRYSDELDHQEESFAEYYAENEDTNPDGLLEKEHVADAFWRFTNYSDGHKLVARDYVDFFNDKFKEVFDIDLGLRFESLTSPKYYNFTTDRIFAYIDDEKAQELFDKLDKDVLRNTIKDRFTSRDGFYSFYSNNIDDWVEKPIEEWDYNEVGTLLEAYVGQVEDFEWSIFAEMCDSETFSQAFNASVDWPKFEQAMKEKLLELAGEIEEDAREFPLGIADTEQYVKAYCAMNHLKE